MMPGIGGIDRSLTAIFPGAAFGTQRQPIDNSSLSSAVELVARSLRRVTFVDDVRSPKQAPIFSGISAGGRCVLTCRGRSNESDI